MISGLARAVLTEEHAVPFAPAQVEVDAVERDHAGEGLAGCPSLMCSNSSGLRLLTAYSFVTGTGTGLPGGRLTAGAADDQPRRRVIDLPGRPPMWSYQRAHGGPPEVARGLGDLRVTGDRCSLEPVDVAERGERDVLGDPQPSARVRRPGRRERHQVVGGEDDSGGSGRSGGSPSVTWAPAVGLEVALGRCRCRAGEPGTRRAPSRRQVDALAPGRGGGGPGDDGELPVPEVARCATRSCGRRPARPTGRRARPRPGSTGLRQDHRRPGPRGVQHPREPPSAGETSKPVDTPRSSSVVTWWSR